MGIWDEVYRLALQGKEYADFSNLFSARTRTGPGKRSCIVMGRKIEENIVQENLRKGKGRWTNSNGRLELRIVALMRKTSEPMPHGLKRDHKQERKIRKARWYFAMRRGRDVDAAQG